MASGGEGFKPGDFYVGVYELFAILLPGAMLTYLVWRLKLESLTPNGFSVRLHGGSSAFRRKELAGL
jgi:hypothetical protein